MKESEVYKFPDVMVSMTMSIDDEETKYLVRTNRPNIHVRDVKKGVKFDISYSYETKEETIGKNTTMHSVITKSIPVKIVKITKKAPKLDIYVEEIK